MDHSEAKQIPVDAWEARRQQEAAFEASLKAYILAQGSKRNVQFGGVSNLAYTLSKVCLQAAEDTGSQDYAVAARAFGALEAELDLPYEALERQS